MDGQISSVNLSLPSKVEFKGNLKPSAPKEKKSTEQKQQISDKVSISREGETPPEHKRVKVVTFPQDPYMDKKPAVEEIDQAEIGKNLEGPRAVVYDRNNPKAIADPDGNFFYTPTQPQFDQVNSFVVVYKTLDMHQGYLGRRIDWAFGEDQITVNPHAGEGANAYYARWAGSVNFLYFKSKGLNKTVQTAQSADVISHELGHAVLDGVKPNYLFSWDSENKAFHEAYADCSAMLYNMSKEENIKGIAKETGGDLRKWNRLSMLAEEFGAAIRLSNDDPSDDNKTYLRNAINNFTYKPASELPSSGPRDVLTSEPHSYSRVFSGAFYDCIESVYKKYLKELPPIPPPERSNQEPKPDIEGALRKARDVMGPVLDKALDLMPNSQASFKDMAISMIRTDEKIFQGKHKKELIDVFLKRKILKPEDIENLEKEDKMLAEIPVDKVPTNEKESFDFLKKYQDKLGIDASTFKSAKVVKDKYGNTYIEFESVKEVPLKKHGIYKAAGIPNVYADVYGGLTLAFGKDGKLFSKIYDPITDQKIKETVNGILESQKKGLVRRQPLYKSDNLFKSHGVPYEAEVYQEPSGKFKVRRLPIIVD